MGLVPARGLVFVEPELREEKTGSGLHIHYGQKLQGIPTIGTVRFIAEDITSVKVGDRVIFNESNPTGYKHEGVGLLVIKIDQVCGVINE